MSLKPISVVLHGVLWSVAGLLLLLSLATAPWYRFWVFELLGTGYLWFAGATLLLLIVLLLVKSLRRKRGVQIVLAIALLLYAQFLLPWYVPRLRDNSSGGTPVSLMTYNVNYRLWNTDAVGEVARTNPSDIFALVEPTREQAAELRDVLRDRYPHYYRSTGGNLSLFSRYEILEARTDSLKSPHQSLLATLDIQGKKVQVVVVRPPTPQTKASFNRRNQVLRSLATHIKEQKSPLIVMGDFNTTAWSFYFQEFEQRSRLRNAARGHGLHPTWYYADLNNAGLNRAAANKALAKNHGLFQWIKVPLDHILVSQSIRVDQVTTAPAGVSDHRPLLARIRV